MLARSMLGALLEYIWITKEVALFDEAIRLRNRI